MRGSMPCCLSRHQQRHRLPLLSTHRKSPNPKALIMVPMGMKGPGGEQCHRGHYVQNGTGEFSRSKSLPAHQRSCRERNGRSQELQRPVDTGPLPVGESSRPILWEAVVSTVTLSNTWGIVATPRYRNMPHPIRLPLCY